MGLSRYIAVSFAGLAAALPVVLADAPPAQPGDIYGKDNTAGVYVRDSAVAMEQMALAQRMAGVGEWSKSADLYQEILQKYSDRVVPSRWDDQDRPVQYTSVTETVREALCKWPADGLDAYRSRYETDAAKLLADAGGDAGSLHQILSLYFPTDSGRDAGIRLMDDYFESGEYAAVAQIGRRLLKWHPNLAAQRPMVIYRIALADKLSGDDEDAQRQAEELRRMYPQATGSVGGRDVILADLLFEQLAATRAVEATGDDSWVTIGGDNSRDKVSTCTIKPGARLYSVELPEDQFLKSGDPNQRREMEQQDATQEQMGAHLGVMPAVDRGELFFQDNANLYAIDLDSGTPLSGWASTWPGGIFKLSGNVRPLPAGQQLGVSLTDKYVAAVMGLPDRLSGGGEDSQSTRLVCLDRSTGRLLWSVSSQELPDSLAALRNSQLATCPLIVGDNLYVIAHGGPGQQFDDCYVLCFNAPDGQFRWASYIASASSDGLGLSPDGMIVVSDVVSDLAYAGGHIFVITNLGAAAAIDAYSGSIAWLNIYRDQNNPPQMNPPFGAIMQNRLGIPIMSAPWKYNPALVQNGRVFILPSDGKYLFIYDAGTGAEIKRIWISDLPDSSDSTKPDTLLAVRGDSVYLAGPSRAWRINWQQYDHEKNPTPDHAWATVNFDQPLLGRGFVTADALYLSSQNALRRILLKNGMIDPHDGTFPKNNWEVDQEGPGNVIAAEDHVIVAGDRYVAVYTDVEMARLRLDRQVAAAPNDPAPRLHYAEVMFASGQPDTALTKLREAFALLADADQTSRDRAFEDSMRFAMRLSGHDPALNNAFFDLANSTAQSPLQKARYRLARAAFDIALADFPATLQLYQEILADPAMASAAVQDDSGSAAPARLVVSQAIARILQMPQGKMAYAPFEHAAADALDRARAADDPVRLQRVAEQYPNSDSAPIAIRAAATAFESHRDFRAATLQLRHLLTQYPDQSRAPILEELACNYLKLPGELATAQTRLSLAAQIAGQQKLSAPLVLPDGSILKDASFAQVSDALNRFSPPEPILPDLHIPTKEQRDAYRARTGQWIPDSFAQPTAIPNVQAMVVPLDGFARPDRLLGWNLNSGLMIFATTAGAPICTSRDVNQPPTGAAWLGAGLLVWTGDVAYLIDPQSGATRWCADLNATPPPPDQSDAVAPAERIEQLNPLHDRIILATNLGRVAAINAADGKIMWQARPVNHEIERLLSNEDFTVVRCSIDQTKNLVVFDSYNGQLLGEKLFTSDADEPINLALADDGTLVYTLADRLCVEDLFDATPGPDGMQPKSATIPSNDNQLFAGATDPSQLLVAFGRIFALSDQGKSVRVYELASAKAWTFQSPQGPEQVPLTTESMNSPNVSLFLVDHRLYVLSPQNLKSYQIDHPWQSWTAGAPVSGPRSFEQILFGKDYLLVVDRQHPPLTASYQTGTRLILQAFSRAIVNNDPEKESGLGPYPRTISEPGDIPAIQPYEGGIAYFAGGAIHLLPGAREQINDGKSDN